MNRIPDNMKIRAGFLIKVFTDTIESHQKLLSDILLGSWHCEMVTTAENNKNTNQKKTHNSFQWLRKKSFSTENTNSSNFYTVNVTVSKPATH